jgi:hypothetical protein
MGKQPNQVEIQDVRTDMLVTEGIGPLSRADVQRIVSLVLDQVRREQRISEQKQNDTEITNRVYPPHVR